LVVIRTTPLHERVSAANQTGLWSHWAGYLVAEKYQMAEKFEYFAIRNSVGVFDTSPLYKYRIHGRDAERFLAGVLARDIRACRPGRAQYTVWCDDRGFVLEDGVIFRHSADEFHLTVARPNLAYFGDLVGRLGVIIEDVSDDYAALAVQGPKSREVLAALTPDVEDLAFFHLTNTKVWDVPVTISRTGYTGDLGYELWIPAGDAVRVWDAVMEAGAGKGMIPFGQIALLMCRIEAGLLLIDVDFESSRFAWNDHHRSTPIELGLRWMFRDLGDRPFIGREAIRRELADGTSRWSMVGLVVDWEEHDRRYRDAGLIAPKDHVPLPDEMMLYDGKGRRAGYATSYMYSPILQRHIAMARVLPELARPGTRVNLEVTINHRYETVGASVARMPLYHPARKTA
jgi:aminomethyltransferase